MLNSDHSILRETPALEDPYPEEGVVALGDAAAVEDPVVAVAAIVPDAELELLLSSVSTLATTDPPNTLAGALDVTPLAACLYAARVLPPVLGERQHRGKDDGPSHSVLPVHLRRINDHCHTGGTMSNLSTVQPNRIGRIHRHGEHGLRFA